MTRYSPQVTIVILFFITKDREMKQHAAPLSISATADIESFTKHVCVSNDETIGLLGPVMVRVED